jgi:hypothetical protein
MKSVAVLISGQIRTGVFKEQILFFERFLLHLQNIFQHVDVYVVLKIPDQHETCFIKSERGIQQLKELLAVWNPVHNVFFYDFHYEKGTRPESNGQLKMIDMCIQHAMEYEKINHRKYDLFFRVRPDSCFLLNELCFDKIHENYVYTAIKEDAPGSDQVFMFNPAMLDHWWKPMIQQWMTHTFVCSTLEYNIFPKEIVKQTFQCWLIRDYEKTSYWCYTRPHAPLHSEYTWLDKKWYDPLLLPMPHETYVCEILTCVPVIYMNLPIE